MSVRNQEMPECVDLDNTKDKKNYFKMKDKEAAYKHKGILGRHIV